MKNIEKGCPSWHFIVTLGISLIKMILSGFSKGSKERCGCKKPCRRRHFDIKRWNNHQHSNENNMQVGKIIRFRI